MHDKELYAVKTRWQSHIAKLKTNLPNFGFFTKPHICSVFNTSEITGDLSTNDLCIHQDCLIVCVLIFLIYIYIYILQNTSQKMYKAKEKKNMQWIQKKTRGLNQNYSSKSSQNKRKIEAL